MTVQIFQKILLIVVAIFFAISLYRTKKEFEKCTQAVNATYDGVGRGLGKSFGHVLLFTYDYNGKHYESVESMTNQTIFSFNRDKMNQKMKELGYEIGQKYTIYVNPEKPERYISDTKSTFKSLTLGVVLILALILLCYLKYN